MFTFYKFYISKVSKTWEVHFLKEGKKTIIKTSSALERFLSNETFLIGFDNFRYCDKLLASILKGIDPFVTLDRIEKEQRVSLWINNPITLDTKQELRTLELDEAKLNLNIDDDLEVIEIIFNERSDYFTSKFEIVKSFRLDPGSLRKTRVNLASDVLRVKKGNDKNRLKIKYDKRIKKDEIPKPLISFYEDIEKKYLQTNNFMQLEKEVFTFNLSGLEHVYGFGGLHAAQKRYVAEGNFMQIDVKSYYPTLIINNDFLEGEPLKRYKAIFNDRKKLQRFEDPKEEAYKTITNIVYGGLKAKWSSLYNPRIANSIVINGQLIITHLISLLGGFCELVQSNTDGIIIKYEKTMKDAILKMVDLFSEQYKIEFDVDYINKIAQRDVNNYVMRYTDGSIVCKGIFNSHQKNDFERNSLKIVPKALVNYYIHGTKPNKTVIEEWKKGNLELFQNIVKAGAYDGMAQEKKQMTLFEGSYSSRYEKINKTNRVFATNEKLLGAIYNTKEGKQVRYTKVPYTSENSIVWNEDLKKFNKRKIALNWYIKEIEKWIF